MNDYEEKLAAFFTLVGQSFSQGLQDVGSHLNEFGKAANENMRNDKNAE